MYGIKYLFMDLVIYYNLLVYVFMFLYINNVKVVVYKSFILNFIFLFEIEKWLFLFKGFYIYVLCFR